MLLLHHKLYAFILNVKTQIPAAGQKEVYNYV